jgi:hypothetical protein
LLLIAPVTLLFYGLALINAKYTFLILDIGACEIVLGCIPFILVLVLFFGQWI